MGPNPLSAFLRVVRVRPWGHFGADQDRTGDLLLAKQALSQLSYSPVALSGQSLHHDHY